MFHRFRRVLPSLGKLAKVYNRSEVLEQTCWQIPTAMDQILQVLEVNCERCSVSLLKEDWRQVLLPIKITCLMKYLSSIFLTLRN